MKVIKTPEENNKLRTMEVTCTGQGCGNGGCGSLLEVNGLDIHQGRYNSMGEVDTYYYITCPVCGKKTEVFWKSENSDIFALAKPDF